MNNRMADIMKLARVQLFLIVPFVLFKFIRPFVLNSDSPEIFKTILLSLPNFFESITGTLVLTGLGLVVNDKLNKKNSVNPKIIYLLAVLLAGVYVITQELGFHGTRPNETYDPNDIIFSVIGLIVGYSIILSIQPRIPTD